MNRYSRKSFAYIFGMNSVYLGNNYLWISFESLFLPYFIELTVPESIDSIVLGTVAFFGIMSGLAFNYISGTLTDRLHTFIGRRRPMILTGSLITVLSLIMLIINHSSIIIVILTYFLIEIGSNIAYGAYQPLIRDIIPSNQRGASSGVNGFFTLAGSGMGFGLSGILLSDKLFIYGILAITLTVTVTSILTFITVRKEDYLTRTDITIRKLASFLKRKIVSSKFKYISVANLFITLGSSGLIFFYYYYFEYGLSLKNASLYVAISGTLILFISALGAIAVGILSDKFNREIMLVIFPFISGISILLISFSHTFYEFLLLGSLIGLSYASYYSIISSYMSFVVPQGRAGQYLSIFLISTETGAAFSPLIYGLILYIFRNNTILSYSRLFEISSLFFFTGVIIIIIGVIKPLSRNHL